MPLALQPAPDIRRGIYIGKPAPRKSELRCQQIFHQCHQPKTSHYVADNDATTAFIQPIACHRQRHRIKRISLSGYSSHYLYYNRRISCHKLSSCLAIMMSACCCDRRATMAIYASIATMPYAAETLFDGIALTAKSPTDVD